MTEGEVTTNGQATATDETNKETEAKIIRQVEYYFGDYNLPRDKFLREEVKNDDGWIPLETMLKFKRLAALSTDGKVITAALKNSTNNFIEVDESNTKIRRSPAHPLPVLDDELKEETMNRTIYCKGFPKDGSVVLDDLLEFFKQYGPIETVLMRYFYDKDAVKKGFKGSVLVVFPNVEKAKAFKEILEVEYKDVALIRKWHKDYIEDKRKEIEERKARKEAKMKENKEAEEVEEEEEFEMPKGAFIHISGFPDGSKVKREDIKAALGEMAEDCAWIDYSQGLTEGYLRFKEEDFNKKVIEKFKDDKLKVSDHEVVLRLVEGEEEEEQLKKMKEARSRARSGVGKKRKFNRGGNRGRGNFHNKKRRV